jgi:hypothetical protein
MSDNLLRTRIGASAQRIRHQKARPVLPSPRLLAGRGRRGGLPHLFNSARVLETTTSSAAVARFSTVRLLAQARERERGPKSAARSLALNREIGERPNPEIVRDRPSVAVMSGGKFAP